jgi:hypothetical protein
MELPVPGRLPAELGKVRSAPRFVVIDTAGYPMPAISRMTWEGHEFLDNIRDAGVWAKTKERLKGIPGIDLAVIAEIAKAEINKKLGLT